MSLHVYEQTRGLPRTLPRAFSHHHRPSSLQPSFPLPSTTFLRSRSLFSGGKPQSSPPQAVPNIFPARSGAISPTGPLQHSPHHALTSSPILHAHRHYCAQQSTPLRRYLAMLPSNFNPSLVNQMAQLPQHNQVDLSQQQVPGVIGNQDQARLWQQMQQMQQQQQQQQQHIPFRPQGGTDMGGGQASNQQVRRSSIILM